MIWIKLQRMQCKKQRSYQGSNLGFGKSEFVFKIPSDNHYTIRPLECWRI